MELKLMKTFTLFFMLSATVIFMIVANAVIADDGDQLLTIDHYVSLHSSVPSIAGQVTQLYVRERLYAATVLRGSSMENRVVLFIHGAGTPAEVGFDVPYQQRKLRFPR